MDTKWLRERSMEQVQALGYSFNPNLPLLDSVRVTRSSDDVINRILVLHACVACSYGFPKPKALDWLGQEGLIEQMTPQESEFLHGKAENKRIAFQWRVEAVWALTWAAGYHLELDFSRTCSESLVNILPDLKTNASSESFRHRCKLRTADEIAAMVDLAYCLHWAIREAKLRGSGQQAKAKKVQDQVIEERRYGLEWLICDEAWDNVSLDT